MNTENHYQETDLGNISLNPRGEYNPEESYEYLDLVVLEGGSYVCLAENGATITGISPESGKTTQYWQVITIPGSLTPEYIAMHDRVVNLSEQVEADAEEVRTAEQNVSGMELNVTQMQEQTRQSAEAAEQSKDSSAGYAASADASRHAAEESKQNIDAQVTGFDSHVAEKTEEAENDIEAARIAANKAIIAQQEQSVNEVARAGIEAISTAQSAAQTATEKAQAADTSEKNAAASETAAKLSETNATKMAEQVAADKEQVANDRTAVENAKQEMTESSAQIEKNTQGIAELKSDLSYLRTHSKNIFEGRIVQGNISSSGVDTDDTKEYFVRTDSYIPIDANVKVSGSPYYFFSLKCPMDMLVLYEYNSNKEFIKSETIGIGDSTDRTGGWRIIDANCSYVRFKIYHSDGATKCTPSDVSFVQIESGYEMTDYVYPYTAKDDTARKTANSALETANSKPSIEDIQSELKVKSNYAGNFINLNPVSTIKTRVYFDVHPSENETWNVKQYGKNMATFAQSASISSTKNDTTYFSVDMPMEKGHTYTISYKQTGQLESALQNSIIVGLGGVTYLSPKNLDDGVVIFKFVAPITGFANVGIYTYNLSSDINISEFQIEYGEERTEFVSPIYKANTIDVTPTTEYVDLLIEPFEGVNNIGVYKDAHMEVSCYENDIAIYNKIDAEQVRWDIACGNIVCIGDSLTDGLYAPTSKGKIKQNYPYYLGRLLNAEVDNIGKSGSYPSEVFNTIYPSQDFSKYDTAIIWLGTNGGLFNDFSDGTQADYYCKLIDGIKSQKTDIQLFIGTVFVTGEINSGVSYASIKETNETIKVIAEMYSIPIIDFSDLTSTGARLLHNMQNNTHFGKSGNIYIANRIANFMQRYFEEDITRVEFGLLPKTSN